MHEFPTVPNVPVTIDPDSQASMAHRVLTALLASPPPPPAAEEDDEDEEDSPELYLPGLVLPTMFLPIPNVGSSPFSMLTWWLPGHHVYYPCTIRRTH